MSFNVIDSINFFSEVTFQSSQSIASHFGSLSGRSVTVVRNKSADNGLSSTERSWDWLEFAARITLFAIECLTIVPALVFTFMKVKEQSQIKSQLEAISERWATQSDTLGGVLELVEKSDNIANKETLKNEFQMLRGAFHSNHDQFKELLPKAKEKLRVLLTNSTLSIKQKEVLREFFGQFATKQDRMYLVSTDGKKFAISSNLARLESDYFSGHDLVGANTNEFAIDAPADLTVVIASYITTQSLDGLTASNAQDLFTLADQLGLEKIKAAARNELLQGSFETLTVRELYDLWQWADGHNEAAIQLMCLQSFSVIPKVNLANAVKGRKYEFSKILEAVESFSGLKAELKYSKDKGLSLLVKVAHLKSLNALAPFVAQGVEVLDFSACEQLNHAVTALPHLLSSKSKITTLNMGRDLKKLSSPHATLSLTEVKSLGEILDKSKVHTLNLYNQKLGATKFRQLCSTITDKSPLRSFGFANNALTYECVTIIETLPIAAQMDVLDCSQNSINDSVWIGSFGAFIANHPSLRELYCDMVGQNWQFISRAVNLKRLMVHGDNDRNYNPVSNTDLFSALRSNLTLERCCIVGGFPGARVALYNNIAETLSAAPHLKIELILGSNDYYHEKIDYQPLAKQFPGRFTMTAD